MVSVAAEWWAPSSNQHTSGSYENILDPGFARFPGCQNLELEGGFENGDFDWSGQWNFVNSANGFDMGGGYGSLAGVSTAEGSGDVALGMGQFYPGQFYPTQTETTGSSPDYLSSIQDPSSISVTARSSPKSKSSTPKSPSPPLKDVKDKVKKRTLNTLAARRYRQKRLDQVSELEAELQETRDEREALKVKCARLEGEVGVLRGLLRQ